MVRLTALQRQILEFLNTQENRTAKSDDIPVICHLISPILSRMVKRGLLERVSRGVYKSIHIPEPRKLYPKEIRILRFINAQVNQTATGKDIGEGVPEKWEKDNRGKDNPYSYLYTMVNRGLLRRVLGGYKALINPE